MAGRILCGLDPLPSLVHVAHFEFGGDDDVAFDLLGRESLPTFHVPVIDGFGEGGYCRVVETCVIKID